MKKMRSDEITVEILRDIRTGILQASDRINQTNECIDAMREDLGRHIVESEVRTATAITDLAGTMLDMTAVLRVQHDLRPRLEKCERDIEALKDRLPDA